jgi:YegS/Rv2252/BmrU family lipid kinase
MSGRFARREAVARRMSDLLQARGIIAQSKATAGPGDATRLAREAVASGSDIIVSYGGDGTLNEIIQGMVGSRARLAVWAGGTSNVVARDLGMPFDVDRLADVIAQEKTRRITLGLARLEDGAERYFVMMAGIGLDASIARGVNKRLKRNTGEFAYWITGIKHLFTWQAQPFVVEVDGKAYESAFALIGNGKGYGGGMLITPHAELEEPLFEVYILPPQANNLAYLKALAACMRGKPESANATLIKGRRIKANSTHEPWVEADGEIIGSLPMTFDITPDALSIIVP